MTAAGSDFDGQVCQPLRWAAEQLGLEPDATPEEVRAAWLRLLPDEDFVPLSEWHWSLAAMLRRFAADQARDAARDYARTATAAA